MMKKILLNGMALALSYAAIAQWNADPLVGTTVSSATAANSKTANVAVSDGAGGMFVAWIDIRTGFTPAVYLQRILAGGTLKFGSDVVVANANNIAGGSSNAKSNLSMVADGAGGVICVWQDARSRNVFNNDEIFGQRIDANGNVLWTVNGVRMTAADSSVSNKISPVVEMLNATEAIVVFGDSRQSTSDLYAQKINIANGATLWVNDVALHGNQAGTSTFQNVLADGSGGAFIVWQDPRTTNNIDVYGQRIDNAGVVQWGASGAAIANNVGNQTQPSFTSDGNGGLVVTYSDFITTGGTDPSIYAQRVNGSGVKQWGTGGVVVCNAANVQSNPYVVRSANNFVITWGDQRVGGTGSRDIYAQGLNAAGTLLWTPLSGVLTDGIPICVASGNQPSSSSQSGYQIVSDSTGGAIIVWDDARGTALDVYAQRINSAGIIQWILNGDTNGIPVSTAAGNQQTPVAVLSAGPRLLVAWRDSRNGNANSEIFAARLQSNGVLPVHSLQLTATAKGTGVDVQWNTIDESNTANFIVEKSADGVSFSAIGSVKAKGAGNGSYGLNDLAPVKGINYYRIKSVDNNRAYLYSAIVPAQFSGSPKAALAFYPNPVQDRLTLQLTNFAKGTYQVSLRDLAGRIVLQKSVQIESGYATLPVSVDGLPAGEYLLQLQGATETLVSKVMKRK